MNYLGSKAIRMFGGALKGWVIEKYKTEISAEIESILSGIGEDKVRFIVEKDLSLWDFWPEKKA